MKSKKFNFVNLSDKSILVISSTWERPDVFLYDLQKEIEKTNAVEIYFDFLLKNGTNDRFYKASCKDGKIIIDSFQKTTLNSDYIAISNNYFAKNLELIEKSVLSNFQKFRLKRILEISMLD